MGQPGNDLAKRHLVRPSRGYPAAVEQVAPLARPGGRGVLEALVAIAVGLLDLALLGVAIAFGPDGFGGDGPVPPGRALLAHVGQAAGACAVLLALVVLLATLSLRSPQARHRVVRPSLALELVASAVLLLSTWQ